MSFTLAEGEAAALEGPKEIPGLKLLSAHVTEELGRPYTIDLDVLATSTCPTPTDVLGLPMAVHLDTGHGVRHFHGLASELRLDASRPHEHLLRLRLRPWIWFLRHTHDCRIFQNLSVPQILREVFARHGFQDFEDETQSSLVREFVVQYRESDLDFAHRLMEDAGLYYFFRHEADRHVLILCDDPSRHELVEHCESLPYRPQNGVGIDEWELLARFEPRRYLVKDYDFKKPRTTLFAQGPNAADGMLGEFEHYEYPGGFDTPEQGEHRAHLGGQVLSAQRERYAGTSKARAIACGARLGVTNHGLHDGEYLVISTSTHVTAHGVHSEAARGQDVVRCSFVAHPAHVPFRLARVTPKPVMAGAHSAVVTGRDEGGIETDEYGRVRIKFQWDRSNTQGMAASCWVRVSQLWAGAGFGGLHLPRAGDEVLVEFLDGDPDRPIIVGRVYNGSHEPPFALPDHKTQSGIRSNSSPGDRQEYNEIRFEDAKGREELSLRAQRNLTQLANADRSATVGGSDTVLVGKDRTLSVTGDLKVNVGDQGGHYELSASATVKITATQSIELRCGETVLRLTPEQLEIKGGGKSTLILHREISARSEQKAELVLSEGSRLAGKQVLLEGADQVKISSKSILLNS